MKYDPSKYVHAVKKVDAEIDNQAISDLTWQLDEKDSENAKKRKGVFPEYSATKKKTPSKQVLEYRALLAQPDDLEIVQVGKQLQGVPQVDIVQGVTKGSVGMNGRVYHSDSDSMEEEEVIDRTTKSNVSMDASSRASNENTRNVGVDSDSSADTDVILARRLPSKGGHDKMQIKCDSGSESDSLCDDLKQKSLISPKGKVDKSKVSTSTLRNSSETKQVKKETPKSKRKNIYKTESDTSKSNTILPLTKLNVAKLYSKGSGKQDANNESEGSADTDQLIARLKQKSPISTQKKPFPNVLHGTSNVSSNFQAEFSSALDYDNTIQCKGYQSDSEESDSQDVFDIIESGKVASLYKDCKSNRTSNVTGSHGKKSDLQRKSGVGRTTVGKDSTNLSRSSAKDQQLRGQTKVKQAMERKGLTQDSHSSDDSSSDVSSSEEHESESSGAEENEALSESVMKRKDGFSDQESEASTEEESSGSESSQDQKPDQPAKNASEEEDETTQVDSSENDEESSEVEDESSDEKSSEEDNVSSKKDNVSSKKDNVSSKEDNVSSEEDEESSEDDESSNGGLESMNTDSDSLEHEDTKTLKEGLKTKLESDSPKSEGKKAKFNEKEMPSAKDAKLEKKKKADKEKKKADKKQDKHAKSEEQRVASLKQREAEAKKQKSAIQQALASLVRKV